MVCKNYTKRQQQYNKDNRDKIREYERRQNEKNPWMRILNTARRRAREKGIEFTITAADLPLYDDNLYCPVFGKKLTRGNRPWCASIDRIDQDKGYTPDNIVVVSYYANRAKNDLSIDELRTLVDFYEQLLKEKANENESSDPEGQRLHNRPSD